jgi:two-component sensor histidine kinase
MQEFSPMLSNRELNLRLRQQEIVAEFGRAALRCDDFVGLLDKASLAAAEGLESMFAKVLEYLPGEMAFVVRAGVGWQPGVVGHARVGGDLQSPAGYAFRSGKPVISNHLESEQRFRTPSLLAEHGIRSAINVLVQADDGAPFGVLEGDSTQRGDFNDHDTNFLQTLANTLAVAVQAQRRQDAREALLVEKEALLAANQALLAEKDLLMREVHHRVKNSLQLVQAMLSMQARVIPAEEGRYHLEEAAARVLAIAAVHRRLYEGGSVRSADAAQYLRALLGDVEQLTPDLAGGRVVALEMETFLLAADDIAPLGLIVVELVTNALKHGRGEVRVAVQRLAEGLEIAVSDQGDGFLPGFDPALRRDGGGLGMRLVVALAKAPEGAAVRVDRSVPFGRMVVRTGFGGSG